MKGLGLWVMPRSQEKHGNVVRAILAGDASAAHSAMFDHMSLVEESFVASL
jgi:DNA-binding FadR family transcriptional regulator